MEYNVKNILFDKISVIVEIFRITTMEADSKIIKK